MGFPLLQTSHSLLPAQILLKFPVTFLLAATVYRTFPSYIAQILSVWAGALKMEGKNWWE